MSGGSAFYVLIYAIFYFVNKVSLFLLYGSAAFPEETVGFGKGNGGTHLLPSVPVSPGQLSAGEGVGARGPAGIAAAEWHSLTALQGDLSSTGQK